MSKKLSAQTPLYLRSTQHFKLTRSRHTGRILPHSATSYPLLAMIMLCVGVLLIGWNSFVAADSGSYTVNVSVGSPPPTIAATIVSPIEGDSFQTNPVIVSGTCPISSYEKLFVNNISNGVAICDQSGHYSIQATLVNGTNSLQVRDYNPGDSAGPISNTVDVTYYPPIINPAPGPISIPTPPPIITTVNDYLTVSGLDNSVPVHLSPTTIPIGPIAITSAQPIFSGTASPFASITVIVHSNPIICHTTANSSGYWQCILPFALTPGLHTVNVSSIDPKNGTKLSIPQFNIEVEGNVAPSIINAINPFRFTSSYTYRVYKINQQLPVQISLSGGTLPYTIYADWGDGQRATITRDKEGSFELAHIYKKSGGYRGSYTINLNASDSKKQQSSMQLIALVTAPLGSTSTTASRSGSSLLSGGINSGATHTFEKYVWSSYGLLSLMLFSFWLGGKQKFKRLKTTNKHHHHHPA
jgi:hypothetical protein